MPIIQFENANINGFIIAQINKYLLLFYAYKMKVIIAVSNYILLIKLQYKCTI